VHFLCCDIYKIPRVARYHGSISVKYARDLCMHIICEPASYMYPKLGYQIVITAEPKASDLDSIGNWV